MAFFAILVFMALVESRRPDILAAIAGGDNMGAAADAQFAATL